MMTITYALAISGVLLYLAVAVILVRGYLRSRNIGFIWLGAAIIVWPPLSHLLEAGERLSTAWALSLILHGQISPGYLLSSLMMSQQLVGICLLLIAVFYLAKAKSSHQAIA